jgi:tryptophanyl-tRNA synthetase
VTDSVGRIFYDPVERPGVANLMDIYCAITGRTTHDAEREFNGCDTLQFKEGVAAAVSEHLAPIQSELARLEADPGFVTRVLDDGADRARSMAEATMLDVRRAIGFTT